MIELLVTVAVIGVLAALLLTTLGSARDTARASLCQSNLRQIGLALLAYADDYRGLVPPAEYKPSGSYTSIQQEGWPGLLVRGGYLSAPWSPTTNDIPASSVFRCPAGLSSSPPSSGTGYTDPANGRPTSYLSEAQNAYMFTWYGINAGTGGGGCWTCATRWPFQRWPSDVGVADTLKRMDRHAEPASVVLIYDGTWMHNGALVNGTHIRGMHARHGRGTRANILFLDGHVESVLCRTLARDASSGIRFRW